MTKSTPKKPRRKTAATNSGKVKNGRSAKQKKQANSPGSTPRKVKNSSSEDQKKLALKPGPKLERTTFRTSRSMDFFTAKELVTQTGHDESEWPQVFLKETIDNSLDACEESDLSPVIDITADECGITVADYGPGLPEETLRTQLDFTVRASNREAYVAPDRGAQGNALKTLLPMPRVVDPDNGRLIIEASGHRHVLTCSADPISQQAVINDDATALPTKGTSIRIEWAASEEDGEVVWPFNDLLPNYEPKHDPDYDPDNDDYGYEIFAKQFREIIEGFAVFNPHATFRLNWFGEKSEWTATNEEWAKWKPDKPTSPHWYEQEHFERLIGAYLTYDGENDHERLVNDFLGEFDGLSGSQKRSKVLKDTGLLRAPLSRLVVDGQFDKALIAVLLASMKKHTRPVKAPRLGVIGEDHLRERLISMGVEPDSFGYSKKLGKEPLPWVLESAFGWLGDGSEDWRKIFAGANWSAAIKNPFRSFGSTGEGLEAALSEQRASQHEPVIFVLHLAHPRVQYTDRGKSALVIGGAQ